VARLIEELPWLIGTLALLVCAWTLCGRFYARIYHHKLRWWAVPFSHGALLFGKRLNDWEK
jgi:lysylphosphatidylglycerol synthetase-like protein (DUF2156 family)